MLHCEASIIRVLRKRKLQLSLFFVFLDLAAPLAEIIV
jgi:hypothetical protein